MPIRNNDKYNIANRIQIIILNDLFSKEYVRLTKTIVNIVNQNKQFMGKDAESFFYQGKLYSEFTHQLVSKTIKTNLHSSLVPQMELYLKDKRKVDYDKGRVNQALALLVLDCRSLQDLKDSLPNCLSDSITELNGLKRIKEEAFNLLEKPRQYAQYLKLKPLIEFYSTTKLLY